MKRRLVTIALIFLLFSAVIPLANVKAELKTIIVPDDYPTITDALGNATSGDMILVRSGTYNEQTLETNKTISLIGEGLTSTTVNLHPPSLPDYILGQFVGNLATAIEFNANRIVVSGFTINSYGAMSITGNDEVITGNAINDYADYWFTVTGNHETIYNNTSNTVIHACCTHSTICSNSGIGTITVDDFYSSNSFFEGSFNSVFDNNMKGVGGATESSSNLYYRNTVNGGGGMYASVGDIVADNTMTDCTQGVNIEQGSNDVIIGNTIADNSGPALATVGYVEGSLTNCGLNNTFVANYIANNAIGILVDTFNQYHSGNFTAYDNDFISNAQQAQIIVSNSTTYWNYVEQGGPWSDYWNSSKQGNYWSDYTSSYPNASEVGSTGIWNTPYYVGSGEQDDLPLVMPFNISSVSLQLPSWANITLPNPLQTTVFPPENLARSTPTILATTSPTIRPTITQTGSAVPSSQSRTLSSNITVLEITLLVVIPLCLSVFSVALIIRHRKKPLQRPEDGDGERT